MPAFSTTTATGILAGDLINETRRHLFSGQEETPNQTLAAVSATQTSIPFTYPLGPAVMQGTIVAVDLEEIRVWATDGAQTATVVQRGVNGTTPAVHAAGEYVAVRPKFSDFRILRALNEELYDLASPANSLFQVVTVDITYNAAVRGYDLTGATDVIKLLEIRFATPGPLKQYPKITDADLERNMPLTDFPSGYALRLNHQGAYPGLPIIVRYASRYGTLTNYTDDTGTVAGLQDYATDIPPLGAAARLVGVRELKRNYTEGQYDPRRFEEVPAGAVARSIQPLLLLRQQRIAACSARLRSDWPVYSYT